MIQERIVEKTQRNEVMVEFDSLSENESFARTVVAAFCMQLDPTLEEISDIKTAVSEAVTNSIIHGYENGPGKIRLHCIREGRLITITIMDEGVGIADIAAAMEPMYTTRPEWERSGMGFSFMEAFMDELEVDSRQGEGTTIIMRKNLGK